MNASIETVQMYLSEIGLEKDPRTQYYAMIKDGPYSLIAYLTSFFIFIEFIGPYFMKSKSGYELRPVMLFLNSLIFGASVAGSVIACMITQFGFKWMDKNTDTFMDEIEIRMNFCFLIFKFVTMYRLVICMLRKKDDKLGLIEKLFPIIQSVIIYLALVTYPCGMFTSIGISDVFVEAFVSGIHVVQSVGGDFKINQTWFNVVKCMRFMHFFTSTIFMIGLFNLPQGPLFLKTLIFCYGLSGCVYMLKSM